MEAAEAFSTDQIRQFCAKRQRSLRIDNPGVVVRFIYSICNVTAGNTRWVATGITGVVQVDRDHGDGGTTAQSNFRCVAGGQEEKAWWVPLDKSMVAQLHYLRIYGT